MRKPVNNRNNKHGGLTGNLIQHATFALTDIKIRGEKRIYDKIQLSLQKTGAWPAECTRQIKKRRGTRPGANRAINNYNQ